MAKREYDDESWLDAWDDHKGWSGFYNESLFVHESDAGRVYGGRGSRVWGLHVYEAQEDPQKQVLQLRRIRDSVHGLLRVHGLLEGTEVSIACVGSEAAALAGFRQDDFRKPFILISSSVLEDKGIGEGDVLDVYCGLGLHEASHLLHTRKVMTHRRSLIVGSMEGLWLDLLEDERIEDFIRKESPGFLQYIVKAKKELFDKKELGNFLINWDMSSDTDKIASIFFAFIRAPHMLTEKHKTWETVLNEAPYACLTEVLRRRPALEVEVIHLAKLVNDLYVRLNSPYEDAYKKLVSKLGDVKQDEKKIGASRTRLDAVRIGSTEVEPRDLSKVIGDVIRKACTEKDKAKIEDFKDRIEYAVQKRRLSDAKPAAAPDSKVTPMKSGDMLAREILSGGDGLEKMEAKDRVVRKAMKLVDDLIKTRGARADFGRVEIERMLERFDKVDGALSESESRELEKFDAERCTELSTWRSASVDAEEARRTVLTFPRPEDHGKSRYKKAKAIVASQSAQIRRVFSFMRAPQNRTVTEQSAGILHRRMLAKARSTDRLFKTSYVSRGVGAHICLLIDESGSMGSVNKEDSKAQNAMFAATCLVEGLRGVRGVLLEVYSHTSCGTHNRDCLVKYLYGPENTTCEALGAYVPGMENYDHRALEVVTDRMQSKVTSSKDDVAKMIIVISDGYPQGSNYGGVEAIAQVRKAVMRASSLNVRVVQVAIGGFESSQAMYENIVAFKDVSQLTRDLRKLVQKVVK